MPNGYDLQLDLALKGMTRQEFQAVAARTLDRQAGAIGELVRLVRDVQAKATQQGEFLADLSVRLDAIERRMPHADE